MGLTASHVETETMPMLFTSRQGHEMNNVSWYGYVCFLHEMHQASNTRLGSVGCQQLDSGLSAERQGLENPKFTFHIAPRGLRLDGNGI
jgi:hypothetical protein